MARLLKVWYDSAKATAGSVSPSLFLFDDKTAKINFPPPDSAVYTCTWDELTTAPDLAQHGANAIGKLQFDQVPLFLEGYRLGRKDSELLKAYPLKREGAGTGNPVKEWNFKHPDHWAWLHLLPDHRAHIHYREASIDAHAAWHDLLQDTHKHYRTAQRAIPQTTLNQARAFIEGYEAGHTRGPQGQAAPKEE